MTRIIPDNISKNRLLFFCLTFSFLAVLFSVFFETFWKEEPCTLCKMQRWVLIAIFSISFVGILSEYKNITLVTIIALLAANFAVALFHALVQLGYVADPCTVPKIQTIEDFSKMLDSKSTCSKVTWSILGLPISVYSTILYALLALVFGKRQLLSKKSNATCLNSDSPSFETLF